MADFDSFDPWASGTGDLAAVLAAADARVAARAASGAGAGGSVQAVPAAPIAAQQPSAPVFRSAPPPPPARPPAHLAMGVLGSVRPLSGGSQDRGSGAPRGTSSMPPAAGPSSTFVRPPGLPPPPLANAFATFRSGTATGSGGGSGVGNTGGAPAAPAPAPAPAPLLVARFLVSPPDPASPGPSVDVQVTAHHPAIAPALEGCGGVWVPASRAWRLPASRATAAAHALASATASVGVRCAIEQLPDLALRLLAAAAAAPDDTRLYASLPPRLEAALMPFQREGVRFGLRHGGRALIGDEMGLGKTVQAIALMAAYRSEWPALIICPSSLREAWAAALTEWLGARADRVVVINTAKEGAGIGAAAAPTYDFVIVSYTLLTKLRAPLERARFRVVTLDESHYIKDGKALRTKDTLPIASRAARCFLLSGTPPHARPKELFSQLGALFPTARLRSMKEFGERYCAHPVGRGPRQFGMYDGASNLDELNRVLTACAMIRRLKADVLAQLPPKRRQQVFLTLEPAAKKELATLSAGLDQARASFAQAAAAGAGGGDAASVLRGEERRAVMDAYHKTALIKRAAVQRYVQDLLDAGPDKFLIFAHHTDMLDAISFTLTRAKVRFMRIDGGVAAGKRQGLVDEFQTDGGMRAAVLSIAAAGVGLTLTGASVVIFAELSWTPGQVIQAEDRAHRIGQARAVNVYYLLLRGSVDDIIWGTLQHKLEAVGGALDGRGAALAVAAPVTVPEAGQATLPGMMAARKGQGGACGAPAPRDHRVSVPAPPPPAAGPGLYDDDDGYSSPVHAAAAAEGGGGTGVGGPAPPLPCYGPTLGPMDRFVSTQGQGGSLGENVSPPGFGGGKRARI